MSRQIGMTRGRPGREGNVLFQFSAFMFLVIVTAASVLGLVLSDFVRAHIIRMHGTFYAVSLSPNFDDILATGNEAEFEALISGLERAGRLPQVKRFGTRQENNCSARPISRKGERAMILFRSLSADRCASSTVSARAFFRSVRFAAIYFFSFRSRTPQDG